MKNIDIEAEKSNTTETRIVDQADTLDCRNKPSNEDESSLKSGRTSDIGSQPVISSAVCVNNEFHYIVKRNRRLLEASHRNEILRITSPVKDTQEDLEPIVDYVQEPLLSLIEACAPLANVIDDLSIYVQLALTETSCEPPDGLTFNESAAIRLYTMEWEDSHASLYSMLNATLKTSDRQALSPYFKYLKLFLTALIKLPCAPLQTVWRGVNKDLSKDFPCGTPVTWWAFSSCTTSLTVLENNMYLSNVGERTLFSVEAINGRKVRAHSHFDYEDEILLLPGTYMEVQSQLSPASGLHIIHLKQIKPIETLLELPYEGAPLYSSEPKKVSWYHKKRTIGELTLLIVLCITGIIVGAVLGIRHVPPPSICYTRAPGIKADLLWSFDCGDAREDIKGLYNGAAENGATYSSPDFSGQGKALNLDRKLSQYIRLPRSLNLGVNTSFTISVWIFSTGYNQATILHDCDAFNSVCIELYILSVNIYARTYNRNKVSVGHWAVYQAWKVNYQSCWIHLAYSFDNQQRILSIYFNGERMEKKYFQPSLFATAKTNNSKTSYIGLNSVDTNPTPFDGLIDQLAISYYVKNDKEILDEATLLCHYKFESNNVTIDSGPNNIQAYSENVYRSLSNNQSSLLFNSTDSYFQTSGFVLLLSKFYAFTIVLWLRPIIIKSDQQNNAIAIFQLASKVQQVSSESYVCFLSLSVININNDRPSFRIYYEQLNMYDDIHRYIVKNNTWVHFGVSYSEGGRISLYINGQLDHISATDNRFSLLLYNPRLAVTIGGNYFDDMVPIKPTNYESRKCFAENPQFNYTQMYGEINDLKVFARALSNSEFANLANSNNKFSS